MRQELQDKLYQKYPEIFCQKDLPSNVSPMGIGISCGDGWYDIIDTLCNLISNHVDWKRRTFNLVTLCNSCGGFLGKPGTAIRKMNEENHKCPISSQSDKNFKCEAVQVKEKFGGLRFYVEGADEQIRGMIAMAESMSFRTCESCGSTTDVTRSPGFWIKYRCSKCWKSE